MAETKEGVVIEAEFVDHVTASLKSITESFKGLEAAHKKTDTSLKTFAKTASIIAAGAIAIKKAFYEPIMAAKEFEKGLAEVGTLSEDVRKDLDKFGDSLLDLSIQTGQTTQDLTKGLYDSISAGVAAADSIQFLGQASKLAVGGVTSVNVAVDGLTTVLNSYGLKAGYAGTVSDAFFTAVKFGKTTVEQLATSLGPLAPTANAAGISFQELLGSVSALTKAAFPTTVAVTSMQQALVAINSLTPEVKSSMEAAGLQFRITGEKGGTLADVMNNIRTASGGSLEGMKQLIPSIEGARAILALSANDGKEFAEVMGLMGDNAGVAEKAFAEMAETSDFKWNQIRATLNALMIDFGSMFLPLIKQVGDFVVRNADTIRFALGVTIAVIQDLGASLVAAFKVVANTINWLVNGAIAMAKGAFLTLVTTVSKLVDVMPDSIVPDGWSEGLSKFQKELKQSTMDSVTASVISFRDAGQALEGESHLFNYLEKVRTEGNKASKTMEDLGEIVKTPTTETILDSSGDKDAKAERKRQQQEIENLEKAYMQRSHEGRLSILAKERDEMLAFKAITEEQKAVIINEYNMREQEELTNQANEMLSLQMEQATIAREAMFANDELSHEERKAFLIQQREDLLTLSQDSADGRLEIEREYNKMVLDEERSMALKSKRNAEIRKQGYEDLVDAIVSGGTTMITTFVKNEKIAKRVSLVSSIIQGALAVQRALASAPFPVNLPGAAAVGIMAASNSAVIASQAFEKGGFPQGRNANIKVNERGQESVLNADATATMGRGMITRLNAGRGGDTFANRVNYSPVFNISGAGEGIIEMLKKDKVEFAKLLKNEIFGRGFSMGMA